RHDDLERRLVRLHVAHLHRARVRPEQTTVSGPEGVLRVAGRVLRREVEGPEVVVIGLQLWPGDDLVAERREHVQQTVGDEREQVKAAPGSSGAGQRDVKGLRTELCPDGLTLQLLQSLVDRGLYRLFERVDLLPARTP